MSVVVTTVRRALWIILVGAGGGAAWAWIRDRNAPPMAPSPPEWPPLTAVPSAQQTGDDAGKTTSTASATAPRTASTAGNTSTTAGGSTTTSIVNALVDAPDARSTKTSGTWVAPLEDGSCPASHPIKANDNSGIFHVPGGRSYDRTQAERCYVSAEAAEADGYRQAKA